MNIPEGYRLVPVKANCDQLHAGASKSGVLFIYEAMVEAAPAVELNAYDEAKERELFEAYHSISSGLEGTDLETEFDRKEDGEYIYMMAADGWKYWEACAKSRARSAE